MANSDMAFGVISQDGNMPKSEAIRNPTVPPTHCLKPMELRTPDHKHLWDGCSQKGCCGLQSSAMVASQTDAWNDTPLFPTRSALDTLEQRDGAG